MQFSFFYSTFYQNLIINKGFLQKNMLNYYFA